MLLKILKWQIYSKQKKFAVKNKLEEANCYVAASPISGYGVFASKDLKAGDIIEENE